MQFSVKTAAETHNSPCLIAGVFEGGKLPAATQALDQASHGYIGRLIHSGVIEGRSGQTLMLFDVPKSGAERVLLVGLGAEKDLTARGYRKVMLRAVRALNDAGIKEAASTLTLLTVKDADAYWLARHAVEAAEEAAYRFDEFKAQSKDKHKPSLQKLTLLIGSRDQAKAADEGVRTGRAVAEGVSLARTLGNLPPNVCTPAYLAEQARKFAKGTKLKVTVLEAAQMKKLGMGALLSVARGSRQAPKLIVMEYHGGAKGQKPHVLVGKGITFDTGGISIKPAASMDEMKFDMCGAASVFGALKAAPDEASAKHVEARIWALWLQTPSDTVALLMVRAKAAMDAKNSDVALQLLDAVVKLRPDYVEGWNRRATLYYLRNDYTHSLQDIEQVLAREPRHFGALAGLGMIMQEVGDDKRALDAFRKALAINPHLEKVPELVKTLSEKVEGRDI